MHENMESKNIMGKKEVTLLDRSKVLVRLMQAEDAAAVAQIEAQLFSRPWSEQSFQSMSVRPETLFVVVQSEESIIGYCGLMLVQGEGDITNVAVSAYMQGRGIGESMLQVAMEWAEKKGVKEFTLEVRVSNTPAIALYKKLGFETEGIRRNFYEEPMEDALIMWKRQEVDGTFTTSF